MRILLFLGVLSVCFSCVKVEEVRILPLYSVYSIVSPTDSLITVFAGNTYSIGESFSIDSGKFISNALVKIFNEENSLSLALNTNTKLYEGVNNNFIKENRTYFLEVIINNDTLRAETKVPKNPTLTIDTTFVEQDQANLIVSWPKANQEAPANYRLLGYVDFDGPFIPFFYWGSEHSIWETQEEYSSGDKITSPIGNFKFSEPFEQGLVSITLESLDKNWYDFNKNLLALQSRTPFTKLFEAPIYFQSNITNALGIFSSYSQSEIHLKMLKK
jgi:hypothetical protein